MQSWETSLDSLRNQAITRFDPEMGILSAMAIFHQQPHRFRRADNTGAEERATLNLIHELLLRSGQSRSSTQH
jgi:hypothetical protein